MTLRDGFLLAARLVLGALCIVSGFSTLVRPIEYFQFAITQYRLVPDILVSPLSYAIAWTELIAGAFLFLGYAYRGASRVVAGLIVLFLIALGLAVFRNLPLDECGCLGGLIHFTPAQTYIIDSILLWLAVWLCRQTATPFALDSALKPTRPSPQVNS